MHGLLGQAGLSWLHLPLWLQPPNSNMETIQCFTYYRCDQYAVEFIPRPPDCEKTTEVLTRWDFTTCSKYLQFKGEKIKDCQGESRINRPLSSWWDGKCLPKLKVNYWTPKIILKCVTGALIWYCLVTTTRTADTSIPMSRVLPHNH